LATLVQPQPAFTTTWSWRLARLRRLRVSELGLLAGAWLQLLAVDLGVRCLGVRRTANLAKQVAPRAARATTEHWQAENYARWLEVAARHHVVRAECLHQSLALHQWLCARGAPSTFVIGVRRAKGEVQAHAWVRLGGRLVGDSDATVAPFAELTAAGADPWQ
jgi:hypothetical protein